MRLPTVRRVPPALSGLLAVVRVLPAVSRPMTILLTSGVLLATALPLAFTVVAGLLVGSVPAAVQGGLDSSAGRHMLALLGAVSLIIVAGRLLAPIQVALATSLGRRVDRYLQERVMSAVMDPVGIAHLEEGAVLDLIEGAQGLGTQGIRPGDGVVALASLLPSWLQVIGSAIILATFRWWLGVIWLLFWPVILYYLQREYIRVGEAATGETSALRRADYYRDLALTPGAAKEVRVWGLTDWIAGRYRGAWRGAMESTWQARKPGRAVIWSSTAVVVAADLIALGLLAWAGAHGNVTLAALAIYTRAVIDASVFRAFDDANMHLAYAAIAVPALLKLEDRLSSPAAGPADVDLHPEAPVREVRFEDLRFRYAGQPVDALAGVNLTIPAGESIAIVGVNGAGKTTIVKLLCGLYEPSGGSIVVDGVDLARVDPARWRTRVAAIFQDFARYHLSASDNVAMGAPALAGDMERLRAAARRAGALDLIESLPDGWETILSRQYTGGIDLSGGQWQRIALARAMFAVEGGARVLILDEPTANLDVRAEAEIYDQFLEMTVGLTTILISHRFSTVRRAHRIVVLREGRIVESGTHDELVEAGAGYAEMFRLQAERFAEETEALRQGVD